MSICCGIDTGQEIDQAFTILHFIFEFTNKVCFQDLSSLPVICRYFVAYGHVCDVWLALELFISYALLPCIWIGVFIGNNVETTRVKN